MNNSKKQKILGDNRDNELKSHQKLGLNQDSQINHLNDP